MNGKDGNDFSFTQMQEDERIVRINGIYDEGKKKVMWMMEVRMKKSLVSMRIVQIWVAVTVILR